VALPRPVEGDVERVGRRLQSVGLPTWSRTHLMVE